MAKGTAAAKSSAPAKASGLWIMLEDDSSREEGSCAQNYSGFRHLHETGGEPRPDEEAFGHHSSRCWFPVQMVRSDSQGLRRTQAGQGGHLRQHAAAEQCGAGLAGRHAAQACEDLEPSQQQDFLFQQRGLPQDSERGGGRARSGFDPSLSASSRRSIRQFECKEQRLLGSEGKGTLVNRPEGSQVWEGMKNSADSQPTLTKRHGVLSLVSSQPREGFQKPGGGETSLREFRNVFTERNRPYRFAQDFFAGTGRITSSLNSRKIPTYPIDICLFDDHDVLRHCIESKIDASPLFGLECHALLFREQENMMAWDLAL